MQFREYRFPTDRRILLEGEEGSWPGILRNVSHNGARIAGITAVRPDEECTLVATQDRIKGRVQRIGDGWIALQFDAPISDAVMGRMKSTPRVIPEKSRRTGSHGFREL